MFKKRTLLEDEEFESCPKNTKIHLLWEIGATRPLQCDGLENLQATGTSINDESLRTLQAMAKEENGKHFSASRGSRSGSFLLTSSQESTTRVDLDRPRRCGGSLVGITEFHPRMMLNPLDTEAYICLQQLLPSLPLLKQEEE